MDFKRQDSLATHASLLERLRDLDDQESWQQFYATYRRLIFSFAIRHGLSSTEAEEVVQETVITVARNLPEYRYDPARCSFKTWLFTLTLWRIRDQIRKRHPKEDSLDRLPGEGAPGNATQNLVQAEVDRISALWEEEWKKDLLERALEKVRAKVDEKHFQVFDLYVMQHWPVYKVAHSLGVSRASVYVIKHRVSGLLRKELEHME
jgi:RNA polymerase sigma-70 factor (ECF subfamily)